MTTAGAPGGRGGGDGPPRERVAAAVRAKYAAVAESAAGRFPYPVGREGAARLGYEPAWLDAVPPAALDRFVGVGNPFSVRRPAPGDRVLDLGCGCGTDAFVAARLAGPRGSVTGLDLSPEMLARAREALASRPAPGLAFVEGDIEDLPFEDGSFDLALSNGALNLVPDKDRAFREIRRVLRDGGALAAADLLVVETIPDAVLADMDAWST